MQAPKSLFRSVILIASLGLNGFLLLILLIQKLNAPTEKLGVLTREVTAGSFGSSDVSFKLPKGLTVMDVSPQGISAIGMFEASRYAVVITTDELNLVDFKPAKLRQFGELYSIDNRQTTTVEPKSK